MEEKRITLQEIITEIGDEVGEKYTWFIIGVDAQGIIDEYISIDDIHREIRLEKLGYYEILWEFLKKITSKLSAVVDFHLIGSQNQEDFLKERAKLNQNFHNWTGFISALDFYIEDGRIYEITGTDTALVERLNKKVSPLPILLM